ncbi:MAG: ABC transporter substrate-binding protein [Acidisphaera sp.]|nr:ABC transporter substrate-binding protein [Acidisphaera sp.]
MTRRTLLLLSGAALAMASLPDCLAFAQTANSAAPAFVQRTGDELIRAMDQAHTPQTKRQALLQIVERTVDVNGIARFCLGRYWRMATPQQQQDYTAVFHQTLINSITARIGDYQGVHFTIGRSAPMGDGTAVQTTVFRPNNPPVDVQWLVSEDGGSPKIIDVQAEGTSMRLTERSDYTSFLQQHGGNVQALIEALRRQAAQQQAG